MDTQNKIVWKKYLPLIQLFFYFGEGFSLTTIILVVPLFLTRELQLSDSTAGSVVALAGLPWFLKFLFAAISDKYPLFGKGRRKPYLFLCAIAGGLSWLLLSRMNEFNYLYMFTVFIVSSTAAFSDATLDGFVVDITPEPHQQVMQSAAWGGRAIGQIVSAAFALPIALEQQNFQSPILYAGIVFFITTISSLAMSEPKSENMKYELRKGFELAFRNSGVKLMLALGFATGCSQIMFGFASVILDNLGISDDAIKKYTALYYVGNAVGAIAISAFQRQDPKKTLTFLLSFAFFWSLAFNWSNTDIFYKIFFFGLGFLLMASVAVYSKMTMSYAPTDVAATMFALFASASNLGLIVIGPLYTGFLLEIFPVVVVLFLASLWFVVAILIIFILQKTEP